MSWGQTYFYQRQLISDLHEEGVFCPFLPLYSTIFILCLRLFVSDFCSFYNAGFGLFLFVCLFFFLLDL